MMKQIFKSLLETKAQYTYAWQKVRKEHREKHPTCQVCGKAKSTEVHHRNHVYRDGNLTDKRNLLAVCAACHKKLHLKRNRPDATDPKCR